ncbi:MAG TPA: hypothetical protein VJB89_01395 [Candidatus Nanoarchaeia archaeon]|nr:hypothetical protein [Candidatus Nanoarchaeia archaeon]
MIKVYRFDSHECAYNLRPSFLGNFLRFREDSFDFISDCYDRRLARIITSILMGSLRRSIDIKRDMRLFYKI